MSRGFLKDVGGVKRLRIVKAGYDANNLNLPYNAVVFDSIFPTNLTPWATGVARVATAGTNLKIVSWPSPGYIPMTIVNVKAANGEIYYNVVPWTSNNPRMFASADGIYLSAGSLNLPFDVSYMAFRVAS
ncbi:hypothetical protein [Brucella rhizosphaerae]|uniref:hypothetical protein n=1 Tax=Brucella rhizosphaerae TaxID=571254 RepID=UPI000B995CF6|nr:hypothetical protein [Brucella rhizosphaerae]